MEEVPQLIDYDYTYDDGNNDNDHVLPMSNYIIHSVRWYAT